MTAYENTPRVCVLPRLSGVGGMVSFQTRLKRGLAERGVGVTHDPGAFPYQAVLVIGGTRALGALWRARRRGIPVVQRLNGMNWLHRVRSTGLRHTLRAEYGNRLLRLIRNRLADRVVYQSEFARRWWERAHGPTPVPASVVHNGVDLNRFSPTGPGRPPGDRVRLLLLEGNLMGGYELGLEHAVGLAERLMRRRPDPVELMVVGQTDARVRGRWSQTAAIPITWTGRVAPERVPEIDRSAHLYFSADLNAACPNAVIEAMACGLPVVAFDTGALSELVDAGAGRVVPYGGNPWRLDPPDLDGLAEGALEVLENLAAFRAGARARAEAHLGMEAMVEAYQAVLLGTGSAHGTRDGAEPGRPDNGQFRPDSGARRRERGAA